MNILRNHNIEKAFFLVALAILMLMLLTLCMSCSTTGIDTLNRVTGPNKPVEQTREQRCKEFGPYCEQERDRK